MAKKRIILVNSFRPEEDMIKQFGFRSEDKRSLPHFFITKDGEIHKKLDENEESNFFVGDPKRDIIVCLENLGWFERLPALNKFSNALGIIQEKTDFFEKKWRDYFYWDIYPNKQIDSLVKVINEMNKTIGIKKVFIGHNTKSAQVQKYNGVVSRSNFHELYTDINPSFPFKEFSEKLKIEVENEK